MTPASAPADPTTERTYERLVIAAATAALAVFMAKILGTYIAASWSGADPSVDLVAGIIPRIAMRTDPATAARIATLSTLAMGVVALGLAAWTVLTARTRRRAATITLSDGTELAAPERDRSRVDRQAIVGRGVAAVITLQTLALETLRHRRGGDAADWPLAWVVVATGLAGIALLGARLWNDRSAAERAVDQGAPT